MAYHVAQYNIARLIAPLDDPRIAGFVAVLVPINQLGDASPGSSGATRPRAATRRQYEYAATR